MAHRKVSNQSNLSRFSRIVFLGTASAQPMPLKRNVSSMVLQTTAGALTMIDCGEATLHQFKLSTLKLSRLQNIFITHLHGDHCYGLFGILRALRFQRELVVLNVYGPKGIKEMIETVMDAADELHHFNLNIVELELPTSPNGKIVDAIDRAIEWISSLSFESMNDDHSFSGWIGDEPVFTTKDVIDLGVIEPGIRCTACRITHRIATFGYVFEEETQSGKLDAAKAMALGAKGRQLGLLKKGHDVVLENGTTVFSKDVVGESISGRKMAVMQDCCDCSSCFKVAENCDLLIHESTFDEAFKDHAIPKGHSTAKMAARNAVEIGAKMLMLTHFSSRFVEEGDDEKEDDKDEEEGGDGNESKKDEVEGPHVLRLQKEAEEVIAESDSQCIVRCAADFMSVWFRKIAVITIDRELALRESNKEHFLHDVTYLEIVADS